MAFFPTVIFFFTIIPFLPIDNLETIVLSYFENVMPDMTYFLLESTVQDLISRKHTTLLSFGFIFGIYYATNSFNAYILEFNSSPILLKKYGYFTGMFISFILVIFFALFMFVAVFTLLSGNYIFRKIRRYY